jgi:hypothetical protein
MALQAEELLGELPLPALEDLDHRDTRVVVRDPSRHAAKLLEGPAVSLHERLRALLGKSLHEHRPRRGQCHDEDRRLRLPPGGPDRRLAEVDLGLARWMRQRQEHLAAADSILTNRILHHCLAAGVAVLVTEAFEDAVGRVLLLRRCLAIVPEDLPNHRQERLQLRLRPLLRLPIARRLVVGQDLLQRVPANLVLRDRSPLAQGAGQHLTPYLAPNLHVAAHSCASL